MTIRYAGTRVPLALLVLVGTVVAAAPDDPQARALLQQARTKETIDGDLRGAIALYQQALRAVTHDRGLAAQALLDLGRAYEKLGSGEARARYQRLVRDFADQKPAVAEARRRLARLLPTTSAVAHVRAWTAPTDVSVWGRVSRDGRYVPVIDGTGNLVLHDLVANTDRRLTNAGRNEDYCGSSAFSPDGKLVAFNWCEGDRVDLRLVRLAEPGTPTARVLLRAEPTIAFVTPHAWSFDSSTIAATVRRTDNSVTLVLVSVADGTSRVIERFDDGFIDNVVFSPDGKRVAYDRRPKRFSTRDIFIVSLENGDRMAAITTAGDDELIGWWKDGRLVFGSDQAGDRAVWTVMVNRDRVGDSSFITELGRRDVLGLSESGTLYSSLCTCFYELQIAPVDYSAGRVTGKPAVFSTVSGAPAAAWSHDGKSLAYLSNRPGNGGRARTSLAIRSMETGQTRDLALPLERVGTAAGRFLVWSRDGHSVFITGENVQDRPGHFQVDVRTGETRELYVAPVGDQLFSPRPSPDGRAIYFRSGSPKKFVLTRVDLQSGAREEVYASPTFVAFRLTSDERLLALADNTPGGSVLRLATADGEPVRELLRLPEGRTFTGGLFFSPDERELSVLVTNAAAKTVTLTLVSVATGAAREIGTGDQPVQNPGHWWSPDSRSLLFRRRSAGGPVETWWLPLDRRAGRKLDLPTGARLTMSAQQPGGTHLVFDAPVPAIGDEVWTLSNFLSVPAGR